MSELHDLKLQSNEKDILTFYSDVPLDNLAVTNTGLLAVARGSEPLILIPSLLV